MFPAVQHGSGAHLRPPRRGQTAPGLTYDDQQSFDEVISRDFGYAHRLNVRRRRDMMEQAKNIGCKAVEPGDVVLVPTTTTAPPQPAVDASPPPAEAAARRKRSTTVGRVIRVSSDRRRLIIRHPGGGPGHVVDSYELAQCKRVPAMYCAWYPTEPPRSDKQKLLGWLPGTKEYQSRALKAKDKSAWVQAELAKYKETNLHLVSAMLLSAASGASGVIFSYKLKACLQSTDAVPPGLLGDAVFQRILRVLRLPGGKPPPGRDAAWGAGSGGGHASGMPGLSSGQAFITATSLNKDKEPTKDTASLFGLNDWASVPNALDVGETVVYKEVMQIVDAVVNGLGAEVFAAKCFALYDPEDTGYIHRDFLQNSRKMRVQDHSEQWERGCCSAQVKVLLDVFTALHRDEEAARLGGGKKGKKEKKDSGFPPGPVVLKGHLAFSEFARALETDPKLVLAFLPVCFQMLHDDSLGQRQYIPSIRARLPPGIQRTYSGFFLTGGC